MFSLYFVVVGYTDMKKHIIIGADTCWGTVIVLERK